jgi:hypothetical protein
VRGILGSNQRHRVSDDSGSTALTVPIAIWEISKKPVSSETQELPAKTLVVHLPETDHTFARQMLPAKPWRVEGLRRSFIVGTSNFTLSVNLGAPESLESDIKESTLTENGVMPSAVKKKEVTLFLEESRGCSAIERRLDDDLELLTEDGVVRCAVEWATESPELGGYKVAAL